MCFIFIASKFLQFLYFYYLKPFHKNINSFRRCFKKSLHVLSECSILKRSVFIIECSVSAKETLSIKGSSTVNPCRPMLTSNPEKKYRVKYISNLGYVEKINGS